MHLCTYVIEERGDGEGTDQQALLSSVIHIQHRSVGGDPLKKKKEHGEKLVDEMGVIVKCLRLKPGI